MLNSAPVRPHPLRLLELRREFISFAYERETMTSISSSASAEVEQLEAFERKSAAIETIFTLAILYVSVLQIFPLDGNMRYIALIPVGILLVLALLLGGGNLLSQIQGAINVD